jgi:fructose-bisphosphate aldolase, class II
VAVLLDHGRDLETVVRAIRSGATSVMYDGSTLPLAENVENTRVVVRLARAMGIAVEAEVGHVAQGADYVGLGGKDDSLLTRPEEAAEFVRLTGVDALAVAVGTAHGVYVGKSPEIDFERLHAIREAVTVPLVMHGGSGTGDDKLARAVAGGIRKINIYTDSALEAKRRIRKALAEEPEKTAFVDMVADAKAAFKEVSARYMDLFGSSGKA